MKSILTRFIFGSIILTVGAWSYFTFFFTPTLSINLGYGSTFEMSIRDGWSAQASYVGGSQQRSVTAVNEQTGQAVAVRDGKFYVSGENQWLYYGEVILGDVFLLNEQGQLVRDGQVLEPTGHVPLEAIHID